MNSDSFENADLPTEDLVNILLSSRDENESESAYWNAIVLLARRATENVFEAARSLCQSSNSLEQRIGCDILAVIGGRHRPFASVSFPLVATIVEKTNSMETLARGIFAIAWLGDARGVDLVLPHLNHPDSNVREMVTHALSSLDEDPRCIDGLIRLTNDSCNAVRKWATLSLGSRTAKDTTAIRETLLARLHDNDAIVRGEALVGLAKRQDERVIQPLLRELEAGTWKNHTIDYGADALSELLDINKYPQLSKWKSNA